MRQPWHRNPVILLCGLSVLLIVGGYWLSRYLPMTEEEAANEAARVQIQHALEIWPGTWQGRQEGLAQIRAAAIRYQRTPPYHVPSLFIFYAGVGCFVCGVIVWLRREPPADVLEDEEPMEASNG
jgi:hypothetical protein